MAAQVNLSSLNLPGHTQSTRVPLKDEGPANPGKITSVPSGALELPWGKCEVRPPRLLGRCSSLNLYGATGDLCRRRRPYDQRRGLCSLPWRTEGRGHNQSLAATRPPRPEPAGEDIREPRGIPSRACPARPCAFPREHRSPARARAPAARVRTAGGGGKVQGAPGAAVGSCPEGEASLECPQTHSVSALKIEGRCSRNCSR